MKNRFLNLVLIGLIATMASCVSTGGPGGGTKDENLVAKGIKAWVDKAPSAARPIWNGISEPTLKDTYVGYLDSYESGAKLLESALSLKPGETAKISAEYDKAYKLLSGLPAELPLLAQDKARAIPMAEVQMKALMDAGSYPAALSTSRGAIKVFGGSEAMAAMVAECNVIIASQKREADADAVFSNAKAKEPFDEKMAAFDAATAAYSKAETALAADASKDGLSKAKSVTTAIARLRRKRQDVAIQKEKALRERSYYYRDRIGEEFARPPVGKKPGSLTLAEVLQNQESVKASVQSVYQEMKAFSERYATALDADTMKEFDDQKKDLDAKIAQVVSEIKTAKEIESRGRVVMPVMIGLFNPMPGSAAESKKSRPAQFGSTGQKAAEYWWGMISIPRGTMNDLVITLSDTRAVRVFGYNTKSGKLIDSKKIIDLVNRGYRAGNSWPVLNAGSQLVTDKYFFEIQSGKTPEYTGEAVVYSSFITRMR